MKVKVYFNIRTGRYSMRAVGGRNTGLVLGSAEDVELANARFLVSEAGRQRVLRDKRKNVHAFVVGDLLAARGLQFKSTLQQDEQREFLAAGRNEFGLGIDEGVRVAYNPYKGPQFRAEWAEGEFTPVVAAASVRLAPRIVRALGLQGAPIKL